MSDDAVIILTGVCAAIACALPGTFLVLRGMSLIGDAISHAVLPGIVVAFLLTGSLSGGTVLFGAAVVGLLTVYLIEWLYRTRRVKEDASIAIVFPALFALLHLEPIHATLAGVLGLYLGLAAHWTGSCWPAIACHAANNLAAVALSAASLDVPSGPLSIAAGLTLAGACAWRARRMLARGAPTPGAAEGKPGLQRGPGSVDR